MNKINKKRLVVLLLICILVTVTLFALYQITRPNIAGYIMWEDDKAIFVQVYETNVSSLRTHELVRVEKNDIITGPQYKAVRIYFDGTFSQTPMGEMYVHGDGQVARKQLNNVYRQINYNP